MISVELRDAARSSEGRTEVEIYLDAAGVELLARQLESLRKGAGHVHLMTPEWAGTELEASPVGSGTVLAHHLRLVLVPTDRNSSRPS